MAFPDASTWRKSPPIRPAYILTGLTLLTLILTSLLLYRSDIPSDSFSPSTWLPHSSSSSLSPLSAQARNVTTENRHLTFEQCGEQFPLLYREADRAREWYAQKGGISLEDVDKSEEHGNARVAVIKNKVYVKGYRGGINTRTQASLAALHETVITSPEPLPDVELILETGDAGDAGDGTLVAFALDRKTDQENLWLMTDFGFYSWPEPLGSDASAFHEVRAATLEAERKLEAEGVAKGMDGMEKREERHKGLGEDGFEVVKEEEFVKEGYDQVDGDMASVEDPNSWNAKISKLLWRGVPMVGERQDLLRAGQDKSWSDVAELDWGNGVGYLTPAEHCSYKYLAHVEGWAYSGRLKYLQLCRSVIITHPLKYVQHFHHLFNTNPHSPDQNMIEIKMPFEEHLDKEMGKLLKDEERAERIASNSWNMFNIQYISPAANECYYRYALRAYASVQNFTPTKGKGVAYESFLLTGSTHWNKH